MPAYGIVDKIYRNFKDMQLTKHTDYAFRSLMYLALMKTELATIQEIAGKFVIPKSHLMKVINKLVVNEYIISIRGKYGGVKLGKEPGDIRLNEIVLLMETTLKPLDCEAQPCVILESCQLKKLLYAAQQAFFDSLANYTLLDVIDSQSSALLGIPIHIE